jgi:hypothetical protein
MVNSPGLANLWIVPKWHAEKFSWLAAFAAVPSFTLFHLPNQCLRSVMNICKRVRTCDCVETVHGLTLLQNNAAREEFVHKYGATIFITGCQPGGDWANTWHWTKVLQPYFQTESSSSSRSYFHIFFLIAFLEETSIRNKKLYSAI